MAVFEPFSAEVPDCQASPEVERDLVGADPFSARVLVAMSPVAITNEAAPTADETIASIIPLHQPKEAKTGAERPLVKALAPHRGIRRLPTQTPPARDRSQRAGPGRDNSSPGPDTGSLGGSWPRIRPPCRRERANPDEWRATQRSARFQAA
jgi:hypothetical protein